MALSSCCCQNGLGLEGVMWLVEVVMMLVLVFMPELGLELGLGLG
jgi:hypothetical protein